MIRTGTLLALLSIASACRGSCPGAIPSAAAPPPQQRHASADVRFLQRMIPHHAQALAMTSLVASHTNRDDIRRIAERITRAQSDEIAAMQRFLRKRGEAVPSADPHAHHGADSAHANMPGMLTREEMLQLERATGARFDRLFLEKMIRHHEGALVMVRELFASPGAAQDSEMYQIAADVDADQRAEINRMQTLLGTFP